MSQKIVGVLHPGKMGVSLAAALKSSGCEVYWASEGRSPKTIERAESQQLRDAGTLRALCRKCGVLLSICPPHAAREVALRCAESGFSGLYIDANAISPQRSIGIATTLAASGIQYVDGGIVGPPAWRHGSTWLHLSGEQAAAAADCFAGSPVQTNVIGPYPGDASALKMCFAAYTKGTTALLGAILVAAETLGVRRELIEQWKIFGPDFGEQSARRVRGAAATAWRFAGEMDEIADTFEQASLPGGFHRAAAEIYRRLAHFKDSAESPDLEDVLAALCKERKP